MSALVAYFSRADENYVSGQLKDIDVGNTEVIAHMIEKLTDADSFKIDPIQPYAKDYNTCIEQAKQDQKRQARPELTDYLPSLDPYDTIYLGYPNYWGTMPMPVFTFLEHYDWKGKKIRPFCTHEGSRMGSSVRDLKKACPQAEIGDGFSIYGSQVQGAEAEVRSWLSQA